SRNWNYYLEENEKEFDLAIMMKLVPVIARQQKELLNYLSHVPAKHILLTGSKESMVKKQSIEKREDAVLQRFIKLCGRNVIKRFEIENEFGYLIE
ncbi:hypothetical protein ACFL0C_02065, partial [Patescibacteria group bacterium]